jgi:serine/threonine protein kinase/tetratricopeptide (TPR) repeat protein
MIGQTLGHYRIDQRIGAGGMGVVYRAHDQRLDRDVALKLLPERLLNDASARERLQKEALALSKLNHPHIAHIYDFDTDSDVTFLVMEYVKGDTLAKKLVGGALPEEVVTSIGVQTASALEDAAEVGIVHRDIKPSNIILTPKGDVKVLDFGLAKLFRARENDLTQSRAEFPEIAGTLPYMAPEQLKGEPSDFRSDIYSLGSVLYELVTGRRPFVSANSIALIAEILNNKPTLPRELSSSVSPGLENILMRCLAKEPARRYQRAAELRVALESITLSQGTIPASVATSATRKPGSGKPYFTVALAIAIFGAGIALWRMPKRQLTVNASRQNELAVLPLNGMGGDSDAAFGSGLIETLTSRLMQLSKDHPLQVVPASEIRANDIKTLHEASQRFGATLGLELNIERAGELIRVNYALVDANKHKQLRGGTVTAPASDPFALEDKVADGVIDALQIELEPGERKELSDYGTTQPSAYDYYLQGRGYLQDFLKPDSIENAIVEFNHALEIDPNYALAYSGLGEAYWRKYDLTGNSDWVSRAKSSCDRAVKLRKDEAAGYNCLGTVYTGTGAYEKAVEGYQQAADLQPTDDRAYQGLALAYERLNKPAEAEQTFRRAIDLKPNDWANYNWLGELYLGHGKYADAESMFSQVAALVPDSYAGYGNLGITYLAEGQYTKALPLLERSVSILATAENTSNLGTLYFQLRRFSDSARVYEKAVSIDRRNYEVWGNLGDAYYWSPGERPKAASAYTSAIKLASERAKINPRDATLLGYLALYHAMLGQRDPSFEYIAKALSISPNDPDLLFSAALVYNQFADKDLSLDFLGKAIAAGYSAATLRDTPNLDNLSSDPRFQKLLGTPSTQH